MWTFAENKFALVILPFDITAARKIGIKPHEQSVKLTHVLLKMSVEWVKFLVPEMGIAWN